VVLASPDRVEGVRTFIEAHGVELPTLIDNESVYATYDREAVGEVHAPYPLHVVIDGNQVIRHLSVDSDPDAIVTVLEVLLEEL
jgi:peroxiredoxin